MLVPPMLLQPLVENAIKHGFRDKIQGLISISVSSIADGIEFVISDNGVGQVDQLHAGGHERRGGRSVTFDRINLFNTQHSFKGEIDVRQLKQLGTEITFSIARVTAQEI